MPELDINTLLLLEIRDLLVPIAHKYRPEYENYLKQVRTEKGQTLKKLVRQGKPVQALQLMDGSRSRGEIVDASKIDRGDMSRLVTVLRENELLESEIDGRPKVIFSGDELKEIYKS